MEAVHTFNPSLLVPFLQQNCSATDDNNHAACTVCLRFVTGSLSSQESRQSYSFGELNFRSKVNGILTSPSNHPNNPSTPTAKVLFAGATKMAPGKASAQPRKEKRNLVRWDSKCFPCFHLEFPMHLGYCFFHGSQKVLPLCFALHGHTSLPAFNLHIPRFCANLNSRY